MVLRRARRAGRCTTVVNISKLCQSQVLQAMNETLLFVQDAVGLYEG